MFKLAQHIEKRMARIDSLAEKAPKPRVALLLAGGDGTRLKELTAHLTGSPIPKQYCPLLRGLSLLEMTLFRARHFAPLQNTKVIINRNHLALAEPQLRTLPKSGIVVQPENRDTGPGLMFALLNVAKTHPDATVAVFPTDHFVDDERAFMAHALRAACIVHRYPEKIAVLGVTPDDPKTDYGYIMPGRVLHTNLTPWRAFHVEAFEEKPNPTIAKSLIHKGGLWNTFVMVFQLKRMLELLRNLAPRDSQKLFDLPASLEKAPALYRDMTPWNFSSRILTRIPEEIIVLEAPDLLWSDWGTRESIESTYRRLNLVPSWRPLAAIPAPVHSSARTASGF